MTTHAPIVFNFNSNEVRTCLINDQPWFVAKDVCEALGINTEQTRRLDQDERGLYLTQTPSGGQQMVIINESGLYALVLRSRKPEARKFAKWVTSEVLPSIRKTGGYQSSEPTEGRLTPAEYEELLAKRGKVIVDKPTSIQAAKQLEHDWMQTPLVGTSAILIRLIEGNKHGAIELVPNGSTIVDIRDPKSVAQFINSACALPEVYEAIYKEITIRTNAYVGRMVKTQSKSWEPTQQIEQSKGAGL